MKYQNELQNSFLSIYNYKKYLQYSTQIKNSNLSFILTTVKVIHQILTQQHHSCISKILALRVTVHNQCVKQNLLFLEKNFFLLIICYLSSDIYDMSVQSNVKQDIEEQKTYRLAMQILWIGNNYFANFIFTNLKDLQTPFVKYCNELIKKGSIPIVKYKYFFKQQLQLISTNLQNKQIYYYSELITLLINNLQQSNISILISILQEGCYQFISEFIKQIKKKLQNNCTLQLLNIFLKSIKVADIQIMIEFERLQIWNKQFEEFCKLINKEKKRLIEIFFKPSLALISQQDWVMKIKSKEVNNEIKKIYKNINCNITNQDQLILSIKEEFISYPQNQPLDQSQKTFQIVQNFQTITSTPNIILKQRNKKYKKSNFILQLQSLNKIKYKKQRIKLSKSLQNINKFMNLINQEQKEEKKMKQRISQLKQKRILKNNKNQKKIKLIQFSNQFKNQNYKICMQKTQFIINFKELLKNNYQLSNKKVKNKKTKLKLFEKKAMLKKKGNFISTPYLKIDFEVINFNQITFQYQSLQYLYKFDSFIMPQMKDNSELKIDYLQKHSKIKHRIKIQNINIAYKCCIFYKKYRDSQELIKLYFTIPFMINRYIRPLQVQPYKILQKFQQKKQDIISFTEFYFEPQLLQTNLSLIHKVKGFYFSDMNWQEVWQKSKKIEYVGFFSLKKYFYIRITLTAELIIKIEGLSQSQDKQIIMRYMKCLQEIFEKQNNQNQFLFKNKK